MVQCFDWRIVDQARQKHQSQFCQFYLYQLSAVGRGFYVSSVQLCRSLPSIAGSRVLSGTPIARPDAITRAITLTTDTKSDARGQAIIRAARACSGCGWPHMLARKKKCCSNRTSAISPIFFALTKNRYGPRGPGKSVAEWRAGQRAPNIADLQSHLSHAVLKKQSGA